jgi:acetolactate synthase-1/2/3 large subunit
MISENIIKAEEDCHMNAAKAILSVLEKYNVTDVFGLPGETTLALYKAWEEFPNIAYRMTRDERSAVFMADAFAKATGKVGICEGPSVGATHMVPGVTEAFCACIPIIVFTSDVALDTTKKNSLTAFDQTSIFKGIVKETHTVTKGSELPFVIRRAFRVATSGKPGPIHIRIPFDIYTQEVPDEEIYAQPRYACFPGIRSVAAEDDIKAVAEIINSSVAPVMICGQGCVHSGAWEAIRKFAEGENFLVGSSINAKGIFSETHPLSIGVIGARGGREWANNLILNADVILYVGSSTDSAETDGWQIPSRNTNQKIVQIDVSEHELGNNYKVIPLFGDASETLTRIFKHTGGKKAASRKAWVENADNARRAFEGRIDDFINSLGDVIHPLSISRSLERIAPDDTFFTIDPGISAVYSAAFMRLKKAGRRTAYNFAMGALGYAIPAGIGAKIALPGRPVIALVGDGSFGFSAGELESSARMNLDITYILFDNLSFGWIRGTELVRRKASLPESYGVFTNFAPVDYVKIASGFGLKAYSASSHSDFEKFLKECLGTPGPKMISLRVAPEDKQLAPVPGWYRYAKSANVENAYGEECL